MPHEHEHDSLYELGKKAAREPKLIKKEDLIRLAQHLLKERDDCSELEKETAERVLHNPEGAKSNEVSLVGKKVSEMK